MDEQSDLHAATDVVLSFAAAMNDWETRRYYRSRVDHGYEFTAERDARLAGLRSVAELNAEYVEIFQRHCTNRKRSSGGPPSSFGKPPSYDGISRQSVIEATQTKPGRIEVIAAGGAFAEQHYKFVLLKKPAGWLIDNALSRIGANGEWIRHSL